MIITFFRDDDELMNSNMSKYTISDFETPGFTIVKSFDKAIQENHPPVGLHNHHIQFLLLQKHKPPQ